MLSTLELANHMPYWGGPFAGGPGFLLILIPLFWIIVIAVLVRVFGRRFRRGGTGAFGHGPFGYGNPAFGGMNSAGRSAESTLAERFAQGDIDEKEYRARLEVLRANAYPQPPVA